MALSRPKSDLVDFQPDLRRAESLAEHGLKLSRVPHFPVRRLMDDQRCRQVRGTDAAT